MLCTARRTWGASRRGTEADLGPPSCDCSLTNVRARAGDCRAGDPAGRRAGAGLVWSDDLLEDQIPRSLSKIKIGIPIITSLPLASNRKRGIDQGVADFSILCLVYRVSSEKRRSVRVFCDM